MTDRFHRSDVDKPKPVVLLEPRAGRALATVASAPPTLTFDATAVAVDGRALTMRICVTAWWETIALQAGPTCTPMVPVHRSVADLVDHVVDIPNLWIDGHECGPWQQWTSQGKPVAGRNFLRASLEANPTLADQVRRAIDTVSHSGLR